MIAASHASRRAISAGIGDAHSRSAAGEPGWLARVAIETVIDEKVVREIIPELKDLGAEGIIEYPLNKVVY